MSEINMNNQYAPQEPQFAAAAAPAKQPIPTKIIAIAAAAVAAIILLVLLFGNGVPGKVEKELEDLVQDTYGYKVKGLDVEMKVSASGAKTYFISGQFKGEIEDDEEFEAYEDYKGGYFTASAMTYKDEVMVNISDIYEKDDKDDFKDAIKDYKEDFDSDAKKDAKEYLKEIAEVIDEEECDLEEALFYVAMSNVDL